MSSPCAGCAKTTYGRVIYTAGVFDMLHEGHLNLLRQSRRLGDLLVVGVVRDDGVEAYKGRRPIQSEHTRLAVVRALREVDLAVLQETTDPTPILEAIRPAIMTHGDDWSELREGQATLERLGIRFLTVRYTAGISSSQLRDRLEHAGA